MKTLFLILIVSFSFITAYCQPIKVAILDFENTSGYTKYDAFGKAISSMLISDLKNSILPAKVEFFERNQLNKLLDEQNLQKTKEFNKNTAVNFGKLIGTNYILVGSVFVFEGTCNITSKLVDVETSEILLAKEIAGSIDDWLILKTDLAELISTELNNPISIGDEYNNSLVNETIISQYATILSKIDEGKLEDAERMRAVFQEMSPNFKYFNDIKDEINSIKEELNEMKEMVETATSYYDLGYKSLEQNNKANAIKFLLKFLDSPDTNDPYCYNKILFVKTTLAEYYYDIGDYENTVKYAKSANNLYPYYSRANEYLLLGTIKLGLKEMYKTQIDFMLNQLNGSNLRRFKDSNNNLKWGGYGFELRDCEASEDARFRFEDLGGYGTIASAAIKLGDLINDNSIKLDTIDDIIKNVYNEISSKLEEFNDEEVYSSTGIIYYYELSATYIDILLTNNEFNEAERIIEKHILMMKDFNEIMDLEKAGNGKTYERNLFEMGLLSDLFRYQLRLRWVFGDYMIDYICCSLQRNDYLEASKVYESLCLETLDDEYGYFSDSYSDVILKVRDMNSSVPLNGNQLKKLVDKKIRDRLLSINLSTSLLDKLKVK